MLFRSWTGIVKNRRKSGGFYWVRANITPMMDGGRIVGYMSVRVKPTRDEIQQSERIYADIRNGRARNLQIKEGNVVDTSMLGAAKRMLSPSLRAGTWVVVGFLSALLATMTAMSFAQSGFSLMSVLGLVATVVALSNMLYVQNRVVQPLLKMQRAAFQLLSGDTRSRIPVEGVSCIVAVARTLEQLRVKLDGVLKDNLAAAGADGGPQIGKHFARDVRVPHDVLRLAQTLLQRKLAAAEEGGIGVRDAAARIRVRDDDLIIGQHVLRLGDRSVHSHDFVDTPQRAARTLALMPLSRCRPGRLFCESSRLNSGSPPTGIGCNAPPRFAAQNERPAPRPSGMRCNGIAHAHRSLLRTRSISLLQRNLT